MNYFIKHYILRNLLASSVKSMQLHCNVSSFCSIRQVSQQIRHQAQLVQVQLKTSASETISILQQQQHLKQQQQLKQQLQQLQAGKQLPRQTSPAIQSQVGKQLPTLPSPAQTVPQPFVATISQCPTPPVQKVVESPLCKTDVQLEGVENLGAETELSTDNSDEKCDDPSQIHGMRTRSHKPT